MVPGAGDGKCRQHNLGLPKVRSVFLAAEVDLAEAVWEGAQQHQQLGFDPLSSLFTADCGRTS